MKSTHNRPTFSTFSTPHFRVYEHTSESDTGGTLLYYEAYVSPREFAATGYDGFDVFIGSVKLAVEREPGRQNEVFEMVFQDYGSDSKRHNGERWIRIDDPDRPHDWGMEKFFQELLLGIRAHLGPLNLDLINYDWFDDDVVLLFHSVHWPAILRHGTGYPITDSSPHYRPLLARLQALVCDAPSSQLTLGAKQ